MHEFIIINFDDIPTEISYHLTKSSCVIGKCEISDQFIVAHYRILAPRYAKFNAYWDSIDNQKTGLSYYGITIFTPSLLLAFFDALKSIELCDEKECLTNLCITAMDQNLCLIHFGI